MNVSRLIQPSAVAVVTKNVGDATNVPAPAPTTLAASRRGKDARSDLESLQVRRTPGAKRKIALCLLAAASCIGAGVGLGYGLHRRPTASVAGTMPATTTIPGATTSATPPNPVASPLLPASFDAAPWLYIAETSFYQADARYAGFGTPSTTVPFLGRGANVQDTRDCRLCSTDVPVTEIFRRIDALSSIPGVNMMRLTLESDRANQTLATDVAYQEDVAAILRYAGTKPNFYVQASLWIDPTLTAQGVPSNTTANELNTLVNLTGNASHVLFGVSNEPKANYDGSSDAGVYRAMNRAVQTIRDAEARLGVGSHVVTVQGTRNWAGDVSYYTQHPITAGGGNQVAYELHAYANASFFASRIAAPAQNLPLIISEFGPSTSSDADAMTLEDTGPLMQLARSLGVPHLAWNFNARCGPSLLDDSTPESACPAPNQPLTLTNPWGKAFLEGMAAPWAL